MQTTMAFVADPDKLPIEQINEVVHLLPEVVLEDIIKRMTDWKAGGGADNDPYMYQQLNFVYNFLNIKGGSNK